MLKIGSKGLGEAGGDVFYISDDLPMFVHLSLSPAAPQYSEAPLERLDGRTQGPSLVCLCGFVFG